MKWLLETAAVAFAMFSAVPVPQFEWNQKNMRYALCAFPLVGAVIGLAWWGWAAAASYLALPAILRGAVLCVLPAVLTGGIHLDGYADVSDALASHASPERKQEILRDPHIGAFAAIRLCVYFAAYFALCCAVEPTAAFLQCVGIGFVLSRAMSGLLLTALPVAEGSSLARTFASAADKRRVGRILTAVILACFAGLYLCGGWLMLLGTVIVAQPMVWYYRRTAQRQFGGISGDLAGWFLVKMEFWLLAAMVLAQQGGRAI